MIEQHVRIPVQIRVSLGTAIALGLLEGKLDAPPTTAYLMTYKENKCSANCGFCTQARESKSSTQKLSRVTWPTFPTPEVTAALSVAAAQGKIRRVCIQALNYPEVFGDLELLVREVKRNTTVAVSVSCQPQTRERMLHLKGAGVDRLGMALDAATETIFRAVKGVDVGGCYCWEKQFRLFEEAIGIFGRGNVSTHVIVGLGESEEEAIWTLQRLVDLEVLPALFAFTPIVGTALEGNLPPIVESYRRLQLVRHLIVSGKARAEQMCFKNGEVIDYGLPEEPLRAIVESGVPFRTTGCPDCNRPYFNEKPSGPIYNYPTAPDRAAIERIKADLE